MARIPTVGTGRLNTAQLSPGERRILARRSKRAAQREYAPVIAADKRAFGTANRAYQVQKQSVRGATNMVENTLAQTLRGLKGSGLKGNYLRQVQDEITSRQQDVASSIPQLLADAATEKASAYRDARTQLLTDRAQKQQSKAQMFNQLLKEERGKASTILKEENKGPSKSEMEGLKNAAKGLQIMISEWKNDPKLQEEFPLVSNEDWLGLVKDLQKSYDGVTLTDAATVVDRLRKHWAGFEKKAAQPAAVTSPHAVSP